MPDYRIYEIGQDGHVVRLLIELTLDDDVTAIAYAEQLPTVEAIEIWEGKRLVDSLCFSANPPNVAAAATHPAGSTLPS
jgi:hypothetical protein